jgi:hypothetical protein
MNRLILRYATPVTIAVLVIFAWVVARRILEGGLGAVLLLAATAGSVWVVGGAVFLSVWPRITVRGYKRALLRGGLGGGPVPVNVLSVAAAGSAEAAGAGRILATGADDLLYLAGWLNVRSGPRVLHVPEMDGRYYSLQFTDPPSGWNVAYVGTRTTGSAAGDFLVCAHGWRGDEPEGMNRIDLPHHAALLLGRVFVAAEDDRPAAYALAAQIRLAPLHAPA